MLRAYYGQIVAMLAMRQLGKDMNLSVNEPRLHSQGPGASRTNQGFKRNRRAELKLSHKRSLK